MKEIINKYKNAKIETSKYSVYSSVLASTKALREEMASSGRSVYLIIVKVENEVYAVFPETATERNNFITAMLRKGYTKRNDRIWSREG